MTRSLLGGGEGCKVISDSLYGHAGVARPNSKHAVFIRNHLCGALDRCVIGRPSRKQ